ncbi:MAG: serine/threonine protein kinase [Labilithrix sp.]|nr:serine/threonine protein kinase [Labilithrix sp.]MCW5810877.1 serine/threonine protein kinase [Labilithrix sp.]
MNANSLSSIRVVPATGEAIRGVGKYRYIGMLAEGGMADVYLAVTQDVGFEKLVVIKQLRPDLAQDPSFVKMFMDEARLAARLNHPNVVQTLEVGTDEKTGLHFIAMEFLEGVPYVRVARKKDALPPPLSFHLRILVDTLRGLHYAHDLRDFDGKPLNVVHRDVSPQNVMIAWAGGVKVLDFGIAKAALAAEARPEDFKGKLEYMAPEQACREEVDRRADVFSVGVMLHEALTRRRLFRKGDDKLMMLAEGRLPHVLHVAPSAPPRLAEICARAMAHERENRYPTADAMADELEAWLLSTQDASARDVGAYVAEVFASTRAKITHAVEEQLARFRRLGSTDEHTMPLQKLPFGFTVDAQETIPPGSMFGPPNAAISGETYRGLGTPVQPPRPETMSAPVVHAAAASIAAAAPLPPAPRTSNVALVVVSIALGTVLLAGAAGGLLVLRAKKQAPPAVEIDEPAPAPAPPPKPEETEEIEEIDYTIRAMPADAKIIVDGATLPNPAIGKRPRDAAQHTIRVEAPGHEPREETITFERSILVTIDLHPLPPPPEPAPKGKRRR